MNYSRAAPLHYRIGYAVSVLAIGLTTLYVNHIIGASIDLALAGNFRLLAVGATLLLAVPLSYGCFNYAVSYLGPKVNERIALELRRKTLLSFIGMPFSASERWHSGDAAARFSDEIAKVSSALTEVMIPFIINVLQMAVAAWYCFTISPLMLIAIVLMLPFATVSSRFFTRQTAQKYRQLRTEEATARTYQQEVLQRIPLLKVFLRESSVSDGFRQIYLGRLAASRALVKQKGVFFVISNFLSYIPVLFYVAIGAYLLDQGQITVGGFVAFSRIAENAIIWPSIDLMRLLAEQAEKNGAMARLEEIWSVESEKNQQANDLPGAGSTLLRVADLCFCYDTGKRALSNVQLTAQTGDLVLIQGPSGSGKSTLFKLLLGFYQANAGQIRLEIAGKGYAAGDDLRRLMAYVPQGNSLLSASIYDNITCGVPVDQYRLDEVATLAGIRDFILSLPQGFQTWIRPQDLSEGQAQRIAIARALLWDKPVLLLDEPCSSLDRGSEALIVRTLQTILPQKLILCVSHQPAMAEIATCCIQLAGGEGEPS